MLKINKDDFFKTIRFINNIVDLTYAYDTAIIQLPDGTIVRGEVESWTDYDNSDQMQVKVNGKTYLVHSSDVALIKD